MQPMPISQGRLKHQPIVAGGFEIVRLKVIVVDNFKAVYKILTALEKAMDLSEFDIMQVGPDALGVTAERWSRFLR